MLDTVRRLDAPEHVCIILHQLGHGGVERVATILANGFARRGIRTELLICARGGPAEQTLLDLAGRDVKILFFRSTSGHRLTDLVLGFPAMGRYLRRANPDLVLSAGNNVSMVSTLLSRGYASPHTALFVKTTNPVLRPHDNAIKRLFRFLWYSLIFRCCDGVLALTDSETTSLVSAFPCLEEKILTVDNPYIDDSCPVNDRSSVHRREGQPLLLAIGRLQGQKRFDVLLNAFSIVSRQMSCRLAILGEGKDREALETLAESLGIAHLVEMPGFVSNVDEWLRTSSLFVLSSDYEGLPAVLLESLAQECPVVTTDCFHGVRDLLENAPCCEVTEKGDPEALAEVIIRSLQRKSDTSGLKVIADRYRFESAIENHVAAIRRIHHAHGVLANQASTKRKLKPWVPGSTALTGSGKRCSTRIQETHDRLRCPE